MLDCGHSTQGNTHSVDDLLTTRQLQELLQVDRITIYRMLNDGRLHGFKVGGQWRFSRREIEAWLQGQQSSQDSGSAPQALLSDLGPSAETLPLSCVQAIQSVCAEALDVAAVTTGLDGVPLTSVSNSCSGARSHTFAVPSKLPVARRVPSGLKATPMTIPA